MIRIGESKKAKRSVFHSAEEAEAYYRKLCERRTDYPATVVLADNFFVRKRYRIDRNWSGSRVLDDEAL
jgi:hypothetical protein